MLPCSICRLTTSVIHSKIVECQNSFVRATFARSTNSTSARNGAPLITERKPMERVYCSEGRSPRLAWVETLKTPENGDSISEHVVGLVDLHPDIFAVFPRIDLVHKNLYWQAHYRLVDWRCITTRAELPYRTRRKPWPQKGTGRARHSNRRTHIWVGGAQCKGPRGPESFFYMLPYAERLNGLVSMLSIRHAQSDLHIVDDFQLSDQLEAKAADIFTEAKAAIGKSDELDDPLSAMNKSRAYRFTKAMNESAIYLRSLVDQLGWGPAVLFVDDYSPDDFLAVQHPDEKGYLLGTENPVSNKLPSNMAISLACAAYANHIEIELAPESSAFTYESVSPRATHPGRGLTFMPLAGLNVWSMVHHDTIVISLKCLELLEKRLIAAHKTVVPDKCRQTPYLQPSPPNWFTDKVEADDGVGDMDQGRHFNDPIVSLHWKKLTS